ncbi:MAG: hypothetical protein QOH67_2432 [Hyphomicrobiales bacterium]|nr:hypothetical protein [Hyphomicrobiales bacterium]
MADGVEDGGLTARADQPRISGSQHFLGGTAFAAVILACGWTLYVNLFEVHPVDVAPTPTITVLAARPAVDAPSTVARKRGLLIAPVFDITLIDPARSFGLPPTSFSRGAPVKQAIQAATQTVHVVQSIPLPTPRPAGLGSASLALAKALPDDPFQKLFGKRTETGIALAYAPADGGVSNDGRSVSSGKLPGNDGVTAIYDISARTVYLPDGTKLEAHSGLGPKMDDPRHVHVKMHGATPPHAYDLAPREALFHGVEALRMHPVGGAEAIFGRAGLLTHSYLLGPNGDSNGCVSFKDYEAFLQAYKSGKVKRLVVVASVDDPQLDLQVAQRQAPKPARTYASSTAGLSRGRIEDDRYFASFNASLASRTSSSART